MIWGEDMQTEDQQIYRNDDSSNGTLEVMKILRQIDRNNVKNFKHIWEQIEALKTHLDSLGQRVEPVDWPSTSIQRNKGGVCHARTFIR